MDSNEIKKRLVNDITPPATQKTAPTLDVKKRQIITVNNAEEQPSDSLLPPAEYTTPKEPAITDAPVENVVPVPKDVAVTSETPSEPTEEPSSEVVKPEPKEPEKLVSAEAPMVNPLPEKSAPAEPEKTQEQTAADVDTPVSEVYQASDALPDDSEKAANDIKENMQEPKLYDTTAYHVAIKETHHGHGSAKAALAFGGVCAVAAVGAAVYFMFQLGS